MYLRPATVTEAVGLLADEAGTAIAGGTDVFPGLVDQPMPARFVDLSAIAEIKGISRGSGGYRIGAGTTWSEIVGAQLPRGFDGLKAAAREVGSVQIQNRGTIGGNLCNASPAADGVPPLLALDAEVELAGATGVRRLPLQNFILGNRKTARRPDEIVTAIHIPDGLAGANSAFLKLGARRYLVISIVMVAANIAFSQDGRVGAARIAVGSASAVAQRLFALEQRLEGLTAAALAEASPTLSELSALTPIDDVRATAAYRREATRVLVARTLAAASAGGHAI